MLRVDSIFRIGVEYLGLLFFMMLMALRAMGFSSFGRALRDLGTAAGAATEVKHQKKNVHPTAMEACRLHAMLVRCVEKGKSL